MTVRIVGPYFYYFKGNSQEVIMFRRKLTVIHFIILFFCVSSLICLAGSGL